jgi:FMN phosphatase YigB (HAD superfamily)
VTPARALMARGRYSTPTGDRGTGASEASERRKPDVQPSAAGGAGLKPRVASFDVFDTMLVRTCGAPEALYLWLGRRLHLRGLLNCTPEMFARARHRVELEVWEREGGPDAPVTLHHFWKELVRVLGLPDGRIDALAAEELALEETVLRPTAHARNLLGRAAVRAVPIVFASDTYFSAAFIEDILRRRGLWPRGARCFSSSDLAASKASGALFRRMASELRVETGDILHLGDNPHTDVRSAARTGTRGTWAAEGRLNRYERLLTDARWETGGVSAAFAGASRMARMNVPAADARTQAIRDVAAGVAAPCIAAFVLWLLRRAAELRLDRLYFVARDGQVIADVASSLVQRLGAGIEIRYLYASRRSVNLAAVYDTTAADLEWVFRDAVRLPLSRVLARLELDAGDLEGVLTPGVRAAVAADRSATPELLAGLADAAASASMRELILRKAVSRRSLVSRYLHQEGLFDPVRCGIVDLGGVGSQARALHRLCAREGALPPRLFFVGLDAHPDPAYARTLAADPWLADAECFLFDQQRQTGAPPVRGLNTAFQMFCTADHGTVTGYDERDGRIEPRLQHAGNEQAEAWGLSVLRDTVREFAAQVVLDRDLVDVEAPLQSIVRSLVQEFMRHPAPEEAAAWGTFRFEGGEMTSPFVKVLAEPYSWSQILRAVLDGRMLLGTFPDPGWNSWHEGSVVRTSGPLRALLVGASRCHRILKHSDSSYADRLVGLVRRLRNPAR